MPSLAESLPVAEVKQQKLLEWNMEAQPGHPETLKELRKRVVGRLRMWRSDQDQDIPTDALKMPVVAGQDGLINVRKAERDAAYEWADTRGRESSWWHKLYIIRRDVEGKLFKSKEPTEQFIVGQQLTGRAIRVFNFSESMMDTECQEDLLDFTDLAVQYFGDKVYDLLQDIVITDFPDKPFKLNGVEQKDQRTGGFMYPELPGTLFINSKHLRNELDQGSLDLEESPFTQVLIHEFTHHAEIFGAPDSEKTDEFAESIGWDVKAMQRDKARGIKTHKNWAPYRPPVASLPRTSIVVEEGRPQENSSVRSLFVKEGDRSHESVVGPAGSPTEYGATSPGESFPEVSVHAVLGSHALNHQMPETRDAWLKYVEQIRGGDIVVPLIWNPVILERRTGDDILYPRTILPDEINVRLKVISWKLIQTAIKNRFRR